LSTTACAPHAGRRDATRDRPHHRLSVRSRTVPGGRPDEERAERPRWRSAGCAKTPAELPATGVDRRARAITIHALWPQPSRHFWSQKCAKLWSRIYHFPWWSGKGWCARPPRGPPYNIRLAATTRHQGDEGGTRTVRHDRGRWWLHARL